MKNKHIVIIVIMLLIGTILPATASIKDQENPQEHLLRILHDSNFNECEIKHNEEQSLRNEIESKTSVNNQNYNIEITRPLNSLYVNDENVFGPGSDPFDGLINSAIAIGPITINVELENFTAEKVKFFIDNELKYIDFYEPYIWTWNEKANFKHSISCKAYSDNDQTPSFIEDTQNIFIFTKGPEPSIDYSYEIYQIDYEVDGISVEDSTFGAIDVTYTGTENPLYFNLELEEDEDQWVVQNIPLLPFEGIGVQQTLTIGFDFGIEDGIDIPEIDVNTGVSEIPINFPQKGYPVPPDPVNPGRRKIKLGSGRPTGQIQPGNPHNEFGDLVESYAAHQGSFPNQDCGWHECVPTAVSNSLKWLQERYGQPPIGKDLSIDAMKEATQWDDSSSDQKDWGCHEGWADLKRTYMEQHGYSVTTTEYPDPDNLDHKATAAECEAAMRELKDGQDVEMNGIKHCAAVVGMAKLEDGRYVIYVSHDTNQDQPGGTIIEKVIYDPNDPNPTAEGGWGFNDDIINGFVVECPSTRLDFKQSDFDVDDGYHQDTPWGDLELKCNPLIESSYQFLNMKFNNQWTIKNLPLRNNDEINDQYIINIPFELGVSKGTMVTSCEYSYELTTEPVSSAPTTMYEAGIQNNLIHLSTGITGQNITYKDPPTGPTTDPIWFLGANIVDSAFHPWGSIVNQDCGNNECVPTAVSNSLKTLKNMHPEDMEDLSDDSDSDTDETDINTMKPVTGWSASGCPSSGDLSSADAWWNKKDSWMSNNDKYPITTEAVDGANALDTVMEAIKDVKDVEMEIPGHAVMVTGIIKLADGTYILEVAHDSDQDHDAGRDGEDDTGGVEITLVKYDPKKNEFSGPGWIQGVKLTGSAAEKTIFVIESISETDETDPTIVIMDPLDNTEVGNPINVTGYASDGTDGSGIVKLDYELTWAGGTYDGGELLIDPPDNYLTFVLGPLNLATFIDPGDWITITLFATDAADNTGEDSITVTWVEEGEDVIPPVCTKTVGEPQWEGGYSIASYTPIWLNAVDPEPGSGVNHIHYEIWQYGDLKGVEDIMDDTVEFTFGMYGVIEGIAEVHWHSVDNAGNVEEEHVQEHLILY